jgi:hypothetical protein
MSKEPGESRNPKNSEKSGEEGKEGKADSEEAHSLLQPRQACGSKIKMDLCPNCA